MENVAFNYKSPMSINFKKISRPIKSWEEEAVSNARYIKSKTDKPIIVALSGGIDSEVVCRSFLRAGIDFSVLTVKHKNNSNEHDIAYAERFCKTFNIKQTIIEVDPFILFGNDNIENYIGQGYIANNIFRYLQLFLLKTIHEMGGCAVLGGGEQLYRNVDDVICLKYTEDFLLTLEWIKNNNILHFPYFFQTTPEMMSSYLEHELVKLLTSNPKYYRCPENGGFSPEKVIIYHSAFSDMDRRRKYHGFENIVDFRLKQQKMLLDRFPQKILHIPISNIKLELGI